MKHPVYFCFHQQRDQDRAVIVSALTGTVDSNCLSDWTDESWAAAQELGETGLRELIDEKLAGTLVTCLLIGERTWEMPWIGPMLNRSHELQHGILAIHVHDIPDHNGNTVKKGSNPMGRLQYKGRGGKAFPFTNGYPTYDWEFAEGEKHLRDWIAEAARIGGTTDDD